MLEVRIPGAASNRRTSLHSGSPLFRTWRRSKTRPSVRSHVGTAVPEVVLRWKRNIDSWGVSLVARCIGATALHGELPEVRPTASTRAILGDAVIV